MGSRLHNLGIQQPRWRQEQGFGIAASVPLALRLVPQAVCMEQSPLILGSLIAREERHVRIGDVQNPIEQHISALLRPSLLLDSRVLYFHIVREAQPLFKANEASPQQAAGYHKEEHCL